MKFIKSVIKTMKDTTWLTAKETRRDTTTVVVMSLAFAVFFGLVDYAASSCDQFVSLIFKRLGITGLFCYNELRTGPSNIFRGFFILQFK